MVESELLILFKTHLYPALIISLLCFVLAQYAHYHWTRRRLYQMAAQRNGPPTLPFIGNLLYFGVSSIDQFNNILGMREEFESPVRLWLGQQLYFGIWKPKDLEIILNSPHALNKSEFYKLLGAIGGNGLLTADAPKWRRHKKIIMPTLNQKILDGFVEVFSEQAEILTQQLKEQAGKGIFDIVEYAGRCGLDIICETAMGVKINAQTTESDFFKWVNTVFDVIVKRMFGVFYYDFLFNFTSMAKEQREATEKIDAFAGAVIAEKKLEYYKKKKEILNQPEALFEFEPRPRKNFLQLLIELSEEGEKLTDGEILDEVKTFLIGASETTASTESFVFIVLGMFPDIQQKVYEETLDVIGPDRSIEHTDLGRLQYLEMVIKETMRIFSIAHLVSRSIENDIKLESCTIPAGSSVMMFLTLTHTDPELWPNPLKFDPDRFLPEEIAKRHSYCYLPFLGGLRKCIGPRYAMMVMKVIIASVVRKYRVSTNYSSVEDIKLKADIALRPENGFKVSIELRE